MAPKKVETSRIFVSNYRLVNDNVEPVPFSVLPIKWSEDEELDGTDSNVEVFLLGNVDGGPRRMHKHVTAWRFSLSNAKLEIFAHSVDNTWIELREPKKSFEEKVRPILVTLHCLHILLRGPQMSERSLWRHLAKTFGLHEVRPFECDLVDHLGLIIEVIGRNERLANSKFLLELLYQTPKEREQNDEDFKAKDTLVDLSDEDKSNESDDPFDDVCAICDEGGDLLCCEGPCRRSFHATPKAAAAAKSHCESLGFTKDEVDAMPYFKCKNCEYHQHQCFICRILGSSNNDMDGTEVFPCASATCGRFYHPHCVSKRLSQYTEDSAEELEKEISQGKSFTCPIHKCRSCKQEEDEDDPDFQFAVCRRCPKSYHRKCLPRKIALKADKRRGIVVRAWEDILPNRVLMYCLKHEMDENLGTATRNHVKFPDVEDEVNKSSSTKRKSSVEEKKRKRLKKIDLTKLLDADTKIRPLNSEAETLRQTPPDERGSGASSSESESRTFIGSSWYNEARLYFAPGPFESYVHHVDVGWVPND